MNAPAVIALVAVIVAAFASMATLVLLLAFGREQREKAPPPGRGWLVVDRCGDGIVDVDPARCPIPVQRAGNPWGPR